MDPFIFDELLAVLYLLAAMVISFCISMAVIQILIIGRIKEENNPAVHCRRLKQTALLDCFVYGLFLLTFIVDHNLNINTIWNIIITVYNIYVVVKCIFGLGIYNSTTVHSDFTLKWEKWSLYIKVFFYAFSMIIQFVIFTDFADKYRRESGNDYCDYFCPRNVTHF